MAELIMSFDFGFRRIGVAVGQRLTGTATPLGIVGAVDGVPDWTQLEKLIKDWQPVRFIVGLPLNMDNSESDMSHRAARFAEKLSGRFGIPAETMDERLSTFEVRQTGTVVKESSTGKKGATGRIRASRKKVTPRKRVDDLAAVVILESWLRQS